MNWTYKGYEVGELPEEIRGFVYIIYYTNGQMYIGSKVVRSELTKPLGKRELEARTDKRQSVNKKVITESKWKTYEGSTKLSEGLTINTKVITHLCTDKRSMTYIEQRELFKVDAPVNPQYLNENIGGKFFDNCLDSVYTGSVNVQGGLFDGETD